MILWQATAIAAVAAGIAGGAAGWKARDWKADGDELARIQAEQRDKLRRQEAAYGAADRHERTREVIRDQIRTVTVEVDRVVQDPAYAGLCLDADGLRIVAAAIGHPASAPAQPDAALPAASAAR